MRNVLYCWRLGQQRESDGSCLLEEYCKSVPIPLASQPPWHSLIVQTGESYTKIELHGQACNKLEAEWDGNMLGDMSSEPVELTPLESA